MLAQVSSARERHVRDAGNRMPLLRSLRAPDGTGPFITWGGGPHLPKVGKNSLHFDIAPPDDDDQHAEVDRLVSLGATRVDIGQGPVGWVVMSDPDGNEFCVLNTG